MLKICYYLLIMLLPYFLTSCDVGAAFLIEIPIPITISGTNTTPPPIPNKLDIIPAKKLAPATKIIIKFFKLYGFSEIFLFRKM